MLHDPVLRVGPIDVHPFGATTALGLALGFGLALWRAWRAGLNVRYFPGTFVLVVLGSFVTARLAYVSMHTEVLRGGAAAVFSIWLGGFNLAGGIMGGVLILAAVTWTRREPFWAWADASAPAASLGLAVGLLGLPAVGEGWGMPTNGPIYMLVAVERRPLELIDASHFHPIFAYELIAFALIFVGASLLDWRWASLGRASDGTTGLIFFVASMVVYGAVRPFTLDASLPTVVFETQALCALAAAAGAAILVTRWWQEYRAASSARELERAHQEAVERRQRFLDAATPEGAPAGPNPIPRRQIDNP